MYRFDGHVKFKKVLFIYNLNNRLLHKTPEMAPENTPCENKTTTKNVIHFGTTMKHQFNNNHGPEPQEIVQSVG